MRLRLAILGSTRGTHMLAIDEAIRQKKLEAEIALVFSNKEDALILSRAESLGLPWQYLPAKDKTRADYDQQLSALLKQYKIDLIVLVGYMRILSQTFVRDWANKIINVHPSLLPAYAGKMDLEVHRAVLADQQQESGCTVHYVTEVLDGGPIIVQKTCSVLPTDTAESLKARIQPLESEALIAAIRRVK